MARTCRIALIAILTLATVSALGQSLYKYQDESGNWVFTDRKPPEEAQAEVRDLLTGEEPPSVSVTTRIVAGDLQVVANNRFVVPVEVVLALDELRNVAYPDPEQPMRWIVDPESTQVLLQLTATETNAVPEIDFRHIWILGDPRAQHVPSRPYRAPFAVANDYRISQAFPVGITHQTPDSWYAVDLAMPIGTDIYAARAGLVFEVASANFRGGTDREQDAASANIVRIMHDDGTHAVYAHLNWNSIRVRPGDRVERGEYIADSGNTGFTTGPHLHFVVLLNRGMRLESVPVSFEGANYSEVQATTGNMLVAY